MLKPAITSRKGIPFYYDKSSSEFRLDPYERYEEMVSRQLVLHYKDKTSERNYSFQLVSDFVSQHIDDDVKNIADIGCGVGRLIGDIAAEWPSIMCYGIDYSYQMLKQSKDINEHGIERVVDASSKGFSPVVIPSRKLNNLHFGLSRASHLPFEKNSLDIIISTFLWDRLDEPMLFLDEVKRCLKDSGKCILVTPQNYQKRENWEQFYPSEKLIKIIEDQNFTLEVVENQIQVSEPLDGHGNTIHWDCVGLVFGSS